MKAIETTYRGYRFRSRLEARWAVFFDALKIRWEYEHQGFQLSNGELYLPDFWLPTFSGGMWAEVKPEGGDISKAERLCIDSGLPVWLCVGTPDVRAYEVLERDENCSTAHTVNAIPKGDQAEFEDRMFWQPGYENADGTIDPEWHDCVGDLVISAVRTSRAARFEHGESPAI